MKPGRKAPNPATKQLSGTFRADRHASIVPLTIAPANQPVQPGYLSSEARAVWEEEIARLIGTGATEADSSIVARYCECEAAFRCAMLAKELPSAALITELRRMGELLGLAGLKSRLTRANAASNATAAPTSPFAPRRLP